MSRGPLVQVVLVVCGVLAVLVMWDVRKHEAALVWATGWTAACWLLVPGWARWPMLALSATALLVTTQAVRHGRARRHAVHRAQQERELELLLACAQREQLTTIETVPARLRAYANAARLLGAHDLDRLLPPPPAEPRPGPGELWRQLDDAHPTAIAASVAAAAGLARPGAVLGGVTARAHRRRRAGIDARGRARRGDGRSGRGRAVGEPAATDPWGSGMTRRRRGGDVRGFYLALGVELPGWVHTEAPVRCFADPDAHQHQDRDASCSVNLQSGAFNCHGCGAHGGTYDAALAKGLSPREAIDLMIAHGLTQRRANRATARNAPPARARDTSPAAADRTGVSARATRPDAAAQRAADHQTVFAVDAEQIGAWAEALGENRQLLDRLRGERGWDERVIRDLQVGFDGERITVPIPDERGAPQGLLRLRMNSSQQPKVLAVPGTRLALIRDPRPRSRGCVWWRGRPTCSPRAPPDSPQSRSRARTRGAPNGPASSRVGG